MIDDDTGGDGVVHEVPCNKTGCKICLAFYPPPDEEGLEETWPTPVVKGGQGRDADELQADIKAVVIVMAILIVSGLGAWGCIELLNWINK